MSRKNTKKSVDFPEQAARLRKLRENLRLKISEIARRIPCSDAQWSSWERGKVKIPEMAEKLIRYQITEPWGRERRIQEDETWAKYCRLSESQRKSVRELINALTEKNHETED